MKISGAQRYRLGKILHFKRRYVEALLRGSKVTTIRRGIVTPTQDRVFLEADGKVLGEARISSLRFTRLGDLTDADAQRDGFSSKEELLSALREIYPDIKQDDWVTVISLEDVTRYSKPIPLEELRERAPDNLEEIARLALAHGVASTLEERRFYALLVSGKRMEEAAAESGLGAAGARRSLKKVLKMLRSLGAVRDET
uniref:ASCH domain-containing protein n=1 Tax=Thermofilum pendens TaxID=2269 RepID=A0A7J3X6D7_THEPE